MSYEADAQVRIANAIATLASEVGRLATAQERIGTILEKDQETREAREKDASS